MCYICILNPMFVRSRNRTSTHARADSHPPSFSLESNKSVRQIERAGRPNLGVKHMLLRSSADRHQDHTNSACLAGRRDPTYLIYDIQYACDALYMPSVTCRPHYSMSAVLVSSLPAVVELNKRQYAKSMPGVMVLPPKYMSSWHHLVPW